MTKKIINKIMSLIIIMTVFLGFGFTTVKAASVPSSIKVTSIGKLNYGGTYYFPVKYTSDGTLAYCTEFYDQFPMGVTMTNPTKVDNGLAYIIANGYHGTKSDYGNDSKMRQYYITQLALYTYLGQANPSRNNDVHNAVWKLVDEAKAAKSSTSSALSVSLSISNKTMKLTSDKEYFISEAITVKSNSGKSMPVSVSANTNAFVVNKDGNKVTTVSNGDVVYIKMPSSQISAGQTITFSMGVSATRSIQNAYVYKPSESKYQNMIPGVTYPSKETASAKVTVQASKEKIVTKTVISKQDITTKKELPGAKLVIKDANGKEVISWTSGTTAKTISGLQAGNYTLCETAAPAGYELYTECIKFTVKADGTTTKVVMYNTPKKEEVKKTTVVISKQDITTKKELPGAKLMIKDANGKEVISWTSGTTAKQITGLTAGNYTLCEIDAPAGYELYTECIKFTVKADGTTTKVVMYNTPKKEEVKQPKLAIVKKDSETKKNVAGAVLVLKDESGKVVEEWTTTTEEKVFSNLKAGKYTLSEIKAPNGYELSTATIDIELKEENKTTSVVFYNTPKKVVTKVQISKQDITTKEELPGATLVIKNSKGEVVNTWVSTTEPKYIEGLEAGKYTLCETQAPNGYVLATECVDFTVKADGSITKVVMYNTKEQKEEVKKSYKTKVFKLDRDTKAAVAGATLVIKNENGEELHRFVSNDTATEFELQPGTYTLNEVSAPDGYLLSDEVVTFTVSEDETVVTEVIMYNTKAVKVPITSSSVSILVYLVGLLGIAYGLKTVLTNARL